MQCNLINLNIMEKEPNLHVKLPENNESEPGSKKSPIEAMDDLIATLRKIKLEFGKREADPIDVSMRRIRNAYSEMIKILDEAKKK